MRKGLTRTLMTVAIALMSVQAMAMAPMISDIPSPVVGGINAVTDTHKFVYPDAMDLNTLASDDYTAQNKLMWSYTGTGLNYRINGVDPIDLSKVDPTSPTTSQIINFTVANGESNPDSKANTVTIRNTRLAPVGGTVTFPATSGIVSADTQLVTFFCSDGNSFSSSTVYFYTDNGGMDRLSIKAPSWTTVKPSDPIPSGTWLLDSGSVVGNVTRKTWNNTSNGVCLDVGTVATGTNMGNVKTDYGYFQLAANSVYRIRATMNSSQTTVGTVPFWDMILENFDGTNGLNLYGMDAYNLDNEGGANAILSSQNGTVYDLIWAPAAVNTAQLNNTSSGLFTSTYNASRNGRLRFRVLDVDSVAATQSNKKFGSICIQSLTIESTPFTSFKTKSVVYNPTSLSSSNVKTTNVNGSTVAFSGGALTITPSAAAKSLELITVLPSTNGSDEAYPFHWDAGEIYMLEVSMAAPDANSATNPFDVMWLSMDAPTNELNVESYITGAGSRLAMPKTTAATYVFFYNSNKETASGTASFHNLRYRIRFANLPELVWGDNSGAVKINSIKVSKVAVQ